MDAVDHFRFLVGAAIVDGRIQPEEKKLLGRAAARLGLDVERANALVREVKQRRAVRLPDFEPGEKEEVYRSLLRVVLADGLIYGNERSYLERVGRHLGFLRVAIAVMYQEVAEEMGVTPQSLEHDTVRDDSSPDKEAEGD